MLRLSPQALESAMSEERSEIDHFFRMPPKSSSLLGDVTCGKILSGQIDESLD